MSEVRLLFLVMRYPHRRALARHVRDGSIFGFLVCLEARGLIRRSGEEYRVTRAGRSELDLTRALTKLISRTAL